MKKKERKKQEGTKQRHKEDLENGGGGRTRNVDREIKDLEKVGERKDDNPKLPQ